MSKQLSFSATLSAFTMVLFALFATAGAVQESHMQADLPMSPLTISAVAE